MQQPTIETVINPYQINDEAYAAYCADAEAARKHLSENRVTIGGSPMEYVQPAAALSVLPERVGIVRFNENDRFEIQCRSGWTDELTSGTGVSVFIGDFQVEGPETETNGSLRDLQKLLYLLRNDLASYKHEGGIGFFETLNKLPAIASRQEKNTDEKRQ